MTPKLDKGVRKLQTNIPHNTDVKISNKIKSNQTGLLNQENSEIQQYIKSTNRS